MGLKCGSDGLWRTSAYIGTHRARSTVTMNFHGSLGVLGLLAATLTASLVGCAGEGTASDATSPAPETGLHVVGNGTAPAAFTLEDVSGIELSAGSFRAQLHQPADLARILENLDVAGATRAPLPEGARCEAMLDVVFLAKDEVGDPILAQAGLACAGAEGEEKRAGWLAIGESTYAITARDLVALERTLFAPLAPLAEE